MTAENQQLTLRLTEVEDKFREANFQRQQLQKRVGVSRRTQQRSAGAG